MINTHRLVLYKNFMYQDIFEDITWLMNHYDNEYYNKEDLVGLCYENVNKLVELASSFGFEGNLWHGFLAHTLANHENAFSTSCEMKGKIEGSLNDLACNDFRIFKNLFDYDFEKLEEVLEVNCFSMIKAYQNICYQSKVFNKRIRDEIHDLGVKLANSIDEYQFLEVITNFYGKVGVGKFGLHKAFRIGVVDEKVEIMKDGLFVI